MDRQDPCSSITIIPHVLVSTIRVGIRIIAIRITAIHGIPGTRLTIIVPLDIIPHGAMVATTEGTTVTIAGITITTTLGGPLQGLSAERKQPTQGLILQCPVQGQQETRVQQVVQRFVPQQIPADLQ
jgi:hypothetical protein